MWKQYRYISHQIQEIQNFVAYLFQDILFHAPEHPDEDLMAVVNKPAKDLLGKVKSCKFYDQLSKLYEECKSLDKDEINSLNTAFINNNQIERLCRKEIKPYRFKDLLKDNQDDENWKKLLKHLKDFCNDLYTEHIYLKAFQDRYGTMNDYYKSLVGHDSMCHCCGIGNILTEDNTPRDAFDHYLPKAIYPFVSLNFHNLLPVCYHCNSAYKKDIDTLFEKNGKNEIQKKAFLPFMYGAIPQYHINVKIELSTCYKKENTRTEDILVTFRCAGHTEEIQTWQRIYKIRERYRAFCRRDETLCLVNDMVNQNFIDPDYAKSEIQKMERMPKVTGNFLKASFAKAVFKSLGVKI